MNEVSFYIIEPVEKSGGVWSDAREIIDASEKTLEEIKEYAQQIVNEDSGLSHVQIVPCMTPVAVLPKGE